MASRIVIVDDEADLVWSTLRLLQSSRPGVEFEGFTEPEAALARIQQAPPDALLTDIRMPGMSGLELLVKARAVAPALPAVVVTAFGSPEVREEVRKRGSVEYVEKPFVLGTLLSALDRALARPSGFSGAVALVSLPDIVQMHALARYSGALLFANGAENATLFFSAGEVLDAECGELRGNEAVYSVLSWPGGAFESRPGVVASERTIFDHWQELLIEGCRRLDETGAGKRDAQGDEDDPEHLLRGLLTEDDNDGEREGEPGRPVGGGRVRGGVRGGQQQRNDAGLAGRGFDEPRGGGGGQHGSGAGEAQDDAEPGPQGPDRGHPHHAEPGVPLDPAGGVQGGAVRVPRPGQVEGEPGAGSAQAGGDGIRPHGLERITMASEKEIGEIFAAMEHDIAGFVGVSLVDLESGMTLAVRSARPDFDLAAASAYNSEMVKLKMKTIKALNLKASLEDVLLTLTDQIHLIKLVTPHTFIYLAAERASTNLAIVRSTVAKYAPRLT